MNVPFPSTRITEGSADLGLTMNRCAFPYGMRSKTLSKVGIGCPISHWNAFANFSSSLATCDIVPGHRNDERTLLCRLQRFTSTCCDTSSKDLRMAFPGRDVLCLGYILLNQPFCFSADKPAQVKVCCVATWWIVWPCLPKTSLSSVEARRSHSSAPISMRYLAPFALCFGHCCIRQCR